MSSDAEESDHNSDINLPDSPIVTSAGGRNNNDDNTESEGLLRSLQYPGSRDGEPGLQDILVWTIQQVREAAIRMHVRADGDGDDGEDGEEGEEIDEYLDASENENANSNRNRNRNDAGTRGVITRAVTTAMGEEYLMEYEAAVARDTLAGLFRYNEEEDEDYVPDFDMDEEDENDASMLDYDEDEYGFGYDDYDDEDDDDDDDDQYYEGEVVRAAEREGGGDNGRTASIEGRSRWQVRTAAHIASAHSELETVPSKTVTELLGKGEFGFQAPRSTRISSELSYPQTTSRWLLQRRLGINPVPQTELTKRFLPNDPGRLVRRYPEPAYGGQFSADGSLFYCYTQEFRVHVYSTKDPARPVLLRSLETAMAEHLPLTSRWTITDADITRDNRFLVHSTRSSILSLSSNVSPDSLSSCETIPLVVNPDYVRDRAVIFSARFSSDNRYIITGNSKPSNSNPDVNIYDIETKRSISMNQEHQKDINSVRFLDDCNNVIISGSDDATVRLWDRRNTSRKCVGVLPGHLEGITCVETRGDGRYIISNGKDQCMKLWDIRKMVDSKKLGPRSQYLGTGYKYQFEHYRCPRVARHPRDASVMTYRGHEVLRTAIRCHFSPAASTDQQYVYSGSSDGDVYIWKLDGTLVKQLHGSLVSRHHPYYSIHYRVNRNDIMGSSSGGVGGGFRVSCVRDCSWHPTQPFLYAPAWTEPSHLDPDPGGAGALLVYSYNHENDPRSNTIHETEYEYKRSRLSNTLINTNRMHIRVSPPPESSNSA